MSQHVSIEELCFEKSKTKLASNITQYGILAASPKNNESQSKNYASLFSRDVGVTSYGLLASDDQGLFDGAKQSLITLIKAQSELGQFPFYYIPETDTVRWWSPGAPDSTLWWGIAFLLYVEKTKDITFYEMYKERLEKAFVWLTYQDTNNDLLIEQGEASDWADEMPRMGTVLYTNALWYWLVSLRVKVEKRKDLVSLQKSIHEGVNTLLWVHKWEDNTLSYVPENAYTAKNVFTKGFIELINAQAVYLPYYLSFVSHKSFEMRCDVYGNILACLVGLADEEKSKLITDQILRSGSNLPYPVKALYPPIYPGERDWKDYMAKGRQDYPWQYHNGGIWPYIGGFWVTWLSHYDKEKAKEELVKLAQANALNNWEFNEYLHGEHGTPMGIPNQSWNMGMYIRAYQETHKT
jgi:glycogen debranching enzyme